MQAPIAERRRSWARARSRSRRSCRPAAARYAPSCVTANGPARPPLAHLESRTQMSDSLPLGSGRHHFFAKRSFSATLSSIASASSFFSCFSPPAPSAVWLPKRPSRRTSLPLVEAGLADPVLAAQIRRLDPSLVLLQYPNDLLFREPLALHRLVLCLGQNSGSLWINSRGQRQVQQAASWIQSRTHAESQAFVEIVATNVEELHNALKTDEIIGTGCVDGGERRTISGEEWHDYSLKFHYAAFMAAHFTGSLGTPVIDVLSVRSFPAAAQKYHGYPSGI